MAVFAIIETTVGRIKSFFNMRTVLILDYLPRVERKKKTN